MPAKRWSSISRPSRSLICSSFCRASSLRQSYSESSCTALAGDGESASSCSSPKRASSSNARASSLRSASTASSSSFLISCRVPSKLFSRSNSRRRRSSSAASRSAPVMFLVPRRSSSDSARRGDVPAITSCPICSSASRRSTGGASGSGPPVYAEYRDECPLTIDGFAFPGHLVNALSQIQRLQGQFQRGGALTLGFRAQPLGDGLDDRKIGQRRQHILRRNTLTRRHRGTALDRGHQRTDIEATECSRRGVGGGAAQQVFEHSLLASFLPGLELQLAAQHVDHGSQVDDPGHWIGLTQHRSAMPRSGGNRLGGRNRKPRRNPGSLVDRVGFPKVAGEPGHHLDQMLRQL